MKRLIILVVAMILLVCSGCAMSGDGVKAGANGPSTSDADLLLTN